MLLIDKIQAIHSIAQHLRQSGEHVADADLLDDAASQIVDIVIRELSVKERQIYEYERRLNGAPDQASLPGLEGTLES